MRIRWYGQSAFAVDDGVRVALDPFGDIEAGLRERGIGFSYPAIEGLEADVLLITHEHLDHNGAEVVGGDPHTIRSTAGTFETPIGEVLAVASEHDDEAGTKRGPNTLFRFELGGLVLCHFGDFGQAALRPEQQRALGGIHVLFLPVGDGPTVGGEAAAAVVRALRPRLVVPMHYRTPAVDFLDPPDAFLEALGARVETAAASEVEVADVVGSADEPTVVLLAAPMR
jgi:L-ascorbate metabolism protein UlaG (beta-lactamase superfamily)